MLRIACAAISSNAKGIFPIIYSLNFLKYFSCFIFKFLIFTTFKMFIFFKAPTSSKEAIIQSLCKPLIDGAMNGENRLRC